MKGIQKRFLCVILAALFLLSVPCGALAGADEERVLLPGEEGFRYEEKASTRRKTPRCITWPA